MSDPAERHMAHALALGRRGLGRVWPNPAVGCVIVRDGVVVGRGWTGDGGTPHAETEALVQAGEAAQGATAYVTLEPCAHHGRTPPCADALVAAGIAEVVVALRDPHPLVDGRGLDRLSEAGVRTRVGVMEAAARRDQRGFLQRVASGRPMVTLKLAASFDGRIATRSGESRWITGHDARRLVHGERMRHDAVLVGGGTARADDPALTVRGMGRVRQPVRIVATAGLDLPADGALATGADAGPLWLLHGPGASEARRQAWAGKARLIEVPVDGRGRLEAAAMLRSLGKAGLTRVFCEGGGELAASLLAAGVVDRLVGMTAGIVLGGDGRAAVGDLRLERLSAAARFALVETTSAGNDVVHVWERRDWA